MLTPPQRITASLLTDSLRDSANAVRAKEQELADLRAERDSLIRDALTIVPMLKLVRVTGLSRERLYKIKTSAPMED